ncbi:uncharacterized protein N7459_000192 [Penicillium hispanicum]|uniref:uncharacterized protein n=1 Tax=Penicillium hispanicum TaxID=1080232 RepID=UPI002540B8E0|nr:uncharacterized protein N7459_000192 [Penicillium hispanicum]KAJ5593984.1 hypothetical protein N7459_000192 [Penicillium hispanicum]
MDPMRPAHPHVPAEPSSSFAPTTSLNPTVNLTSAVNQPSNPFSIPSKPVTQPFTSPLQTTAACAAQPAMSRMQPLSQTLNDPSRAAEMPVGPQGLNAETIPRSEAASAAQQPADIYPHQVDGLGGPTATAPFLQEFNLVAEAAKRAQMSIVMRDLESVTL